MPEYLPGQQLTAVQQSAVRKTGANARVDRSRYDNTRVYRGKDGKTYVETTDKQLVAITTGTAPSTTTESSSQTANTALDTAGAAQNTANAVQQEVTDARTSTQGTCATLKEHLQAVWDALTGHTARTDNPHGVTAEQVGAIPTSDKGVAGGVAILDPQGFLTSAEIPPVAINDIHLVASEAEMLALSAQKGDVAIRTDQNNMTFILRLEPAATLSNWQQIGVAPDMPVVTSVNGQTGVVVIDDVDTVDGKHAAQFLQCNSNASAIQVNGIDLNTLMSAGLYWATSCLNRPLEVSGSVIVIPRDSSYLTQLYMTYANQVYCRALSSGTWTMWVNLRDAETVDGKHATDFAPSGYGLGQTSPWIDVDLNTVVKTGFYYAGSNSTNKPVTENGWLLVEAYSNLYAKQIYSTPTGAYYLRTLNNGTWGSWQKIWHAGNDGAGSGLDADMVDGKHATDFAPVGYGLGTMTPYYHDDLNNATTTGFFYAASDATNKPVSHNGWLLVEGLDTNYVKQTYCSYTNEYFLRTRNYGTWSSWQKIWHTGNDGSGSGLDADTCDGQHLSSTDTPTFAGIAQTGQMVQKTFAVGFSNGVANQIFDVFFPYLNQGAIRIRVMGAYNYVNSLGCIEKVVTGGWPSSGTANNVTSVNTLAMGSLPNNCTISDPYWDSTNSRWAFKIVNRGSYGFNCVVEVEAVDTSNPLSSYTTPVKAGLGVSAIYTTDSTTYAAFTTTLNADTCDGQHLGATNAPTFAYETLKNAVDSANTGTIIQTYFSRGSISSPTQILSGDFILNINARGHDGTSYSTYGTAALIMQAEEAFTPTSQGTSFSVHTTPIGSTSRQLRVKVAADGTLQALAGLKVTGNVGFFGITPVAQQAALTAANTSTVDTIYGLAEADVINNLRTRVNELEARLKAYGLLP